MATLTLRTNITCAICINGNFSGFLYKDKALTLPLPDSYTYFSAVPEDFNYPTLNCFLSCENGLRLLPCSGKLYKWTDNIYELFFNFEKPTSSPPPVIIKEGLWDKHTVGLCGGYFLIETQHGYKYFPEIIDGYEIISADHALLTKGATVFIINKNMEKILKRDFCTYEINQGKTILRFTPGNMDFFTVEQVFIKAIVSSKIIQADCVSTFDRLRCFCQAVRLNLNCSNFLTPSLLNQMSIENVKDFLGVFDQTDSCRYLAKDDENSLALRYMIDPYNFHYLCYHFNVDSASGLIDDIFEI